MAVWDNVPYELQSPRWRNALNSTPETRNTWNPSLNMSFVDKFASAFQKLPQVNTGSIDGTADNVSWLKGLTSAVLANVGAQSENQAQFQPVGYVPASGGGAGMSPMLMMGVAALAVGAVVYSVSK